MKLDTSLPKNEKGLEMLLKTLVDASRDRALWATTQRKLSIAEILSFDAFVTDKLSVLNKESSKFLKDAENFVETFVLDDNKCIENEGFLFKDMRRSMIGVRGILIKASPYHGMHSYKFRNTTLPNVYETSLLSGATPMSNDMFGIESFGDEVKRLCNHIAEYFKILYDTITQCINILKEERAVKRDPELCDYYYQRFVDSVIKEFMKAMELYNISPSSLNNMVNPLYLERKKFNTESEFIQHLYHNDSPKNVKIYILQEKYCGKTVNDMTPEENILFGDNYEKVKKIRYAIAHFNEVAHMPKHGKLNKIDMASIACFALWCGIDNTKEQVHAFYNYFNTMYSKVENRVKIASEGRVYKSVREMSHEDRSFFNNKLNNLFCNVDFTKSDKTAAELS
ncbi:MAG: hypothetical protein KBT33_09075 [Prevotellaceae bacterium]|nr:hypothetical protein [Candidatus Minthosoma equi]